MARYSGISRSSIGFDRVAAMAIRSLIQYIAKLKTNAMPSAIVAPPRPPNAAPMATNRPISPAIRIHVLALFTSPSFGYALPGFPPRREEDLRLLPAKVSLGGFSLSGAGPSRGVLTAFRVLSYSPPLGRLYRRPPISDRKSTRL